MIVESAQVVAIENQHVIVQTQRRNACGACVAQDGCGISLLSKILPNRFCRLKVVNSVNAAVGDTVQIGLPESGLVKSALVLYALPLLLVAAAIALATAVFGPDLTDLAAIIFSLSGFILGLIFVRLLGKRMGGRAEYQVKILSVAKCNSDLSPISFHGRL